MPPFAPLFPLPAQPITLDDPCRAIESFWQVNGGPRAIKKNLHYLLLTAYSKDTVLAWDDINEIRVLQRSISRLIDLLHAPYLAGLLDLVTVDYSHFGCGKEFVEPSLFFMAFFESREPGEWRLVMEELFGAALVHDSAIYQRETVGNPIEVAAYLVDFLGVSDCLVTQWRGNQLLPPSTESC